MNIVHFTNNLMRVIHAQEIQLRPSCYPSSFGASKKQGFTAIYALLPNDDRLGHNYSFRDDNPFIFLCRIDQENVETIKNTFSNKMFQTFCESLSMEYDDIFSEYTETDLLGLYILSNATESNTFNIPYLLAQNWIALE